MDRALPILCENCGYDVDSLVARLGAEPDLKCPECATPLRESLPERRTGTPWQRGRSIRSLLGTVRLVVFEPRPAFRLMRIDSRGAFLLQMIIAISTGVVWPSAQCLAVLAVFVKERDEWPSWEFAINRLLVWSVGWLVIFVGCHVALRVLFLVRRWRLAPHAANQIVAHSLALLLLGPVLMTPLIVAAVFVNLVVLLVNEPTTFGGYASTLVVGAVYMLAIAVALSAVAIVPIGAIGALLVSLRSVRFANPPRETAP